MYDYLKKDIYTQTCKRILRTPRTSGDTDLHHNTSYKKSKCLCKTFGKLLSLSELLSLSTFGIFWGLAGC